MAKPTPVASAEEAATLRRRLRRLVAAVAAGSADADAFDEATEALRGVELGPRKDRSAGGDGVNKGGTEAAAVPDPVVLTSARCPLPPRRAEQATLVAGCPPPPRRAEQATLVAGLPHPAAPTLEQESGQGAAAPSSRTHITAALREWIEEREIAMFWSP